MWIALAVIAACKDDKGAPGASASASAFASASASALALASASASASAGPVTLSGTYKATAGTLYVPDAAAFNGFKYRGDDDAGALGEGPLTLTVDLDAGVVTGALQGPLGPGAITGTARDGTIAFNVTPSASDLAFSGVGTGVFDGGAASGDMHLSSWHANVLRDATFQVSSRPAPPPPK